MKDIQNSLDNRGIAIQKVGVKDVHLPFFIKTANDSFQPVLAKINFTVDLPMHHKGTHMSRFIEILNEWSQKPIGKHELDGILAESLVKLNAKSAYLRLEFKYFIQKKAPVSGKTSLLDIECSFEGTKVQNDPIDFALEVAIPFTSLCPCSKEISRYGAHNQRGLMRVKIKFTDDDHYTTIEELAELLEREACCAIFPLLKREDEKFVTEYAYDNPKFVEDVLRDLVIALRQTDGISWFHIECENYESIHNHSAYASHTEDLNN